MRYNGGLFGGTWPANLLADLGGGILDGAWLVQNFEHLNPASTIWKKPYDLYARVDTDAQKFLDFERWWGGYYLMSKEEIREIVDNLFVGNRLVRGIKLPDGRTIDLKRITSPVVVFASRGDNISPPQQALDWIIDVYGHEDLIVGLGHTIVYLLDQDAGHLAIFVGGRVARKEHRELISVMEVLDDLPPGLYEMIIEQRPRNAATDLADADTYRVRFETRTVDDIRAMNPGRRAGEPLFSTIKQVAEITERLYESLASPAVRALGASIPAELQRALHPLRVRQYVLSDLNPFLLTLPFLAAVAREDRRPASEDNIFVQYERRFSTMIVSALNFYRDVRDCCVEQAVRSVYGPTGLGAFWPPERAPRARGRGARRREFRGGSAGRPLRARGSRRSGRADAGHRDPRARRRRPAFAQNRQRVERARDWAAPDLRGSVSLPAGRAGAARAARPREGGAVPHQIVADQGRPRAGPRRRVADLESGSRDVPIRSRPWHRWSRTPLTSTRPGTSPRPWPREGRRHER